MLSFIALVFVSAIGLWSAEGCAYRILVLNIFSFTQRVLLYSSQVQYFKNEFQF